MPRKKGSKDKKLRKRRGGDSVIMRVPVSLKDHFKSLIQVFKKKVD